MSDEPRPGNQADARKSRGTEHDEFVSSSDSRVARLERLIQQQHDQPKQGVRRVTVDRDGTEHHEFVDSTDPRLAQLAGLIEEQLSVEIIMGRLGVSWEEIDQAGLQPTAFSPSLKRLITTTPFDAAKTLWLTQAVEPENLQSPTKLTGIPPERLDGVRVARLGCGSN